MDEIDKILTEIQKTVARLDALLNSSILSLPERVARLEESKSELKWFAGILIGLVALLIAILK
jgi:hypothetical protein